MVQALQSLKSRVAAGEGRTNAAEAWVCKNLHQMSELRALVVCRPGELESMGRAFTR